MITMKYWFYITFQWEPLHKWVSSDKVTRTNSYFSQSFNFSFLQRFRQHDWFTTVDFLICLIHGGHPCSSVSEHVHLGADPVMTGVWWNSLFNRQHCDSFLRGKLRVLSSCVLYPKTDQVRISSVEMQWVVLSVIRLSLVEFWRQWDLCSSRQVKLGACDYLLRRTKTDNRQL